MSKIIPQNSYFSSYQSHTLKPYATYQRHDLKTKRQVKTMIISNKSTQSSNLTGPHYGNSTHPPGGQGEGGGGATRRGPHQASQASPTQDVLHPQRLQRGADTSPEGVDSTKSP